MLRTSDLDYDLPPGRIATRPAEPRDSARLLVCSRTDPDRIEHRTVRELPDVLAPGDALVFNTTRVLPARLLGRKQGSGGRFPGLFVHEAAPGEWIVLLKGHRLREGTALDLLDPEERETGVSIVLGPREGEGWRAHVRGASGQSAAAILARAGATPLPPYILHARKERREHDPDAHDRGWYQTVYAAQSGESVAAPTAGLHFTPDLLARLAERGVSRQDVTLHVGLGTFRPVETEYVEQHPMHAEWCEAAGETLGALARARAGGGRIVAVGTTSARTLESAPPVGSAEAPGGFQGETRILIAPGHAWRNVDALLTNFHLPRSTLLAMVGALFPEGPSRLLSVYRNALREGYRFYSYGDAMLVLP